MAEPFHQHGMYGAGAWGVTFPHLEEAVSQLVEEVRLVEDVQWQKAQQELLLLGYAVGPTSAASYFLACQYCETRSDKRVFIVFYDQSDRY